MPFTLPNFNLNVTAWRFPKNPNQAADSNFAGQFYINTRQNNDNEWVGRTGAIPPTWLRCPLGTDVQVGDIVEIPTGTGRYYFVGNVDIAHLGFPNAYTLALTSQATGLLFGSMLMESGDRLLLESGDLILLDLVA